MKGFSLDEGKIYHIVSTWSWAFGLENDINDELIEYAEGKRILLVYQNRKLKILKWFHKRKYINLFQNIAETRKFMYPIN